MEPNDRIGFSDGRVKLADILLIPSRCLIRVPVLSNIQDVDPVIRVFTVPALHSLGELEEARLPEVADEDRRSGEVWLAAFVLDKACVLAKFGRDHAPSRIAR
jgi:hypothetical protein